MHLSPLPHTTSAIFLAGKWTEVHEKIIIVTDSLSVFQEICNLGPIIFNKEILPLSHSGELFCLGEKEKGIFLIHTDLFRSEGNLEENKRKYTKNWQRNESVAPGMLIEGLLTLGYTQATHPGESLTYRRDGSIIRIWKDASEYMIEYFDDTIESIIEKNGDQIHHKQNLLLPSEIPFPPPTTIKINKELFSLLSGWSGIMISCEFLQEREEVSQIFTDTLELSSLSIEGSENLTLSKLDIEDLEGLRTLLSSHDAPLIFTKYAKRLQEFADENKLSHIRIMESRHTYESFLLRENSQLLGKKWKISEKDSFLFIGDDIIGKIFIQNRIRKGSIKNLDLLLSIKPNDYVVHREHGIGRYKQILRKRIGLIEREYMEIEYAGESKVFVPLTELSRVTKYVGEENPELMKLEGKEWEKALSKTEEEVEIIAAELLATDAKRRLEKGISFKSLPDEERAFEKAFPHIHTADQAGIIQEIRSDMEDGIPMDRLISGDVGFGKTEVAMNAIYKAVLSGMQVACISPLLILAEEHRETFEERLGAFGVRIASLTRMTSTREEKRILEAIKEGTVDVVVGTHRLLSEDIRFRRLGLLVIDEEHRFGVSQKETIKKMKSHIDILSLSATPIPRSLNMALSGMKKISILATPPRAKKPINTIISRWDESIIQKAIEKEMDRGGQVIILHNRIRSLPMIEQEIEEITDKKARIITIHGQLPAEVIEDRIHAFKHGKYDILLSTTVIENGVNFLGANTIIVSDAEEFGLAQLHQIRGRVGRKDIAGVCYLMYRKHELSGDERERMMVLAENSSLGSGFEIAMRDMQIRGTGDILGFRQSGKTKEVGISLYFQLLEEKVEELKNGKKKTLGCKIELELSYVIEDEFFDSEMDKVSFFRDIDSIETLEDLDYAEATFGSGEMPENMKNLFLSLRTSIILTGYNVKRISKIGTSYHFDFQEGSRPDDLRRFLERFDPKGEMIIVSISKIRIETTLWKSPREFLTSLV